MVAEVLAVDVEVDAGLLDDEDAGSEGEEVVELPPGELVEGATQNADQEARMAACARHGPRSARGSPPREP